MSGLGQPVDKSATMPVYIVTVQDREKKDFIYIKTRKDLLDFCKDHIELRGCIITKTEANKLKKVQDKKDISRDLGKREDQIHWYISTSLFVKAEHITFNGIA